MERDHENTFMDESNNDDLQEDVQVGPGGILAGNLTAGSPASGIMSGMVGGGPGSRLVSDDEGEGTVEGSTLNLDALDALDGGGDRPTQTGDDGVSPQQKELEAGEMNG